MDKCPNCGYQEVQVNKKFTHEMSEYVDSETGKSNGIFNSNDAKITIQPKGKPQQTLIRADLFKPKVTTPVPVEKPVLTK